ncbi:MAG TPA: DsbA family oxidoreductase [Candidatus Binataceae bacterium]|nr:DsbA family oxidoreductase [Candidatus Binataceae bacterium]
MALKLVMYSDFICPFCYVGFAVVRKLKAEFDLELDWRGFQIHPEWPAEGMPAAEWHNGMDAATRRAVWERIGAMGAAAGLSLKAPAILTNSRLALEAAQFAIEAGAGEAFEERVFRAYFSEGRNIGSAAVLGDLAAEVGLKPDDLTVAFESNRYHDRLHENTHEAHERGVSGVPTFYVGKFPMVGAQSEDVMRMLLQRASERRAVLQ